MSIDTLTVIHAIATYAIPVLFAISLHEVAHGYTARHFGDPTAAEEGRLSINPLRHIDPLGTILLPLVLYALISLPFGYARPVPVEFDKLRKPKTQMVYVALAGPLANVAMGLAWAIANLALLQSALYSPFLYKMTVAGMQVNAVMVVFNLLPVPPLDGGRVLIGLLPERFGQWMARLENYNPLPPPPLAEGQAPGNSLAERLGRGLDDLRVYDIVIFATLIVLMKLHVLDSFLGKYIAHLMKLFTWFAFSFFSYF